MRKLFQALGALLEKGEAAVLVTIVAESGSVPRGAGARMLVAQDGRVCGTIGGGAVEHESERAALEILASSGRSQIRHYRLHENEIQDLGMICGGEVRVYFHYIPPGDPGLLALTGEIEALFRRGEASWLISEITQGRAGALGVYGSAAGLTGIQVPEAMLTRLGDRPVQICVDKRVLFCEPLVQSGKVYVFGGGHVAQALVPVLASVAFRCVVLEDRAEFCRAALFPGAEETILIDPCRALDFATITEADYVVIVTRGHKDDQVLQAQVLQTPARYIGVIGSRRKAERTFAALREMGVPDRALARIVTPIGLEIQAETPAEIAVSIAAQLIQARAGQLRRTAGL